LQQISRDCTASEGLDSVTATSSHVHTYKTDFMSINRDQNNVPYASSIVCRHDAITRTVNVNSLSSLHDRSSFRSHLTLSSIDTNRQHHSLVSPSASLSSSVNSRQSHGAPGQPAFLSAAHASGVARGMQSSQAPPSFAIPSSVFQNQLQSLPTWSSVTGETPVITQQLLPRDHPSYAINRLREKIGRGWLPPEPPYPPPPDDTPESQGIFLAESGGATIVSSHEQNKISASALPVADACEVYPESELCTEPPLVDSTTEVTTTTDAVDEDADELESETVTYATKRPVEREDGEISDDEPDSVGADLPPDSSGISSSNIHWNQSRPQSFRGFRGGTMMTAYRPQFPYRGRFPRGRAFFRGRGFAPWQQWYDQRPARNWSAADDEHIVDSSSVLSPPMEMTRKHSISSRSPVHSPISSSDSEHGEDTRRSISDHHSSRSDWRSRHKSKSKHDDHPVADSTRSSVVSSQDFELSSDSDKEQPSHSSANKKKVGCSPYMS